MDRIKSKLFFTVRANINRKVLIGGVLMTLTPLLLYLLARLVAKRRRKPTAKDPNEAELTVDRIRKIIEEMPYDPKPGDSNLSLRDFLGELKEISDEEEWKKLMQSMQTHPGSVSETEI